MAVSEIKATKKIGDVEKEAAIAFDFGGSCEAAVASFGAEVVYANFVRSAIITAQAAIRRLLEIGKNQEEITAKMASWKPGVPMERVVDAEALLLAKAAKMTDAEREALIEKLMAAR
jgi:hypothetical protein